jgi:hypothetical protein
MSQTVGLQTAGYRVDFHVTPVDRPGEFLDAVVELALGPELGGLTIRSVPNFVTVGEMRRLVRYLEEHVVRLLEDPSHESYTFAPTEAGFNVRALAGDVASDTEGAFSLLFLVNVGFNATDGTRVYAGAESVIDVEKVKEFAGSLGAAVPDLIASR